MAVNMNKTLFRNLLIIKNQLMMMTKEELLKAYEEVEEYKVFVSTIIWLIKYEPAFVYMDESINNDIRSVFDIHRFELKDDIAFDTINSLTTCLNYIDAMPEEDKRKGVYYYRNYQEKIRCVKFDKAYDFKYSLGFDAFVYFYLKGELDMPEKNYTLMVASLNYFLETCPEFFADEGIYNKTMDMIKDISKNSSTFDIPTKVVAARMKKKINEIALKRE